MNLRQAPALLVCLATSLLLQSCVEYYPASGFNPPTPPPTLPPEYAEMPASQPPLPTPQEVAGPDDSLVAPIALYPDPLIALILPASTSPADISSAASFLVQYGSSSGVDSQPWDPSVRALSHYPPVIAWMAANMGWTEALGAAFLSSPTEVMDAVQRLRNRAIATGALVSTQQQQVYSDGGEIEIYPAQADALYVPAYDDNLVFADGAYGYAGPFINFGDPYPAGPWLSFYFDWGQHRVWAGDRNVWRERSGWQPPRVGGDRPPPGAHQWRHSGPGPGSFGPPADSRGSSVPSPRPIRGAPPAPSQRNGQLAPRPTQSAAPGTAAPRTEQAQSRYRSLPPPPSRASSAPTSRGTAPSSRSEPVHAAAPATTSTNQQPQK